MVEFRLVSLLSAATAVRRSDLTTSARSAASIAVKRSSKAKTWA